MIRTGLVKAVRKSGSVFKPLAFIIILGVLPGCAARTVQSPLESFRSPFFYYPPTIPQSIEFRDSTPERKHNIIGFINLVGKPDEKELLLAAVRDYAAQMGGDAVLTIVNEPVYEHVINFPVYSPGMLRIIPYGLTGAEIIYAFPEGTKPSYKKTLFYYGEVIKYLPDEEAPRKVGRRLSDDERNQASKLLYDYELIRDERLGTASGGEEYKRLSVEMTWLKDELKKIGFFRIGDPEMRALTLQAKSHAWPARKNLIKDYGPKKFPRKD